MINNKNPSRVSRRDLGRLAAGTVLGLAMPPTIGRAQAATLRVTSIQATTGPSSPYGWRARDRPQLLADDINAPEASRRHAHNRPIGYTHHSTQYIPPATIRSRP